MDVLKNILENVWIKRAFWSVIIIFFNFLVYRIAVGFLSHRENRKSRILSDKKNKTFIQVLKKVIAAIIFILTTLTVLQICGVDVSSMLAGVGVVGIVVGFALQDSLKDIIRGFNIISDSYYELGDTIAYDDNVGVVTAVSLLTTKIQDVNTNNIVSIANRNIEKVEKLTGYLYIPVPLPRELKLDKATEIMKEIAKALPKQDTIASAAYQGVTKLDEYSTNYQVVVVCTDPSNYLQTRRDALGVIVSHLETHKITIPYPILDVRTK